MNQFFIDLTDTLPILKINGCENPGFMVPPFISSDGFSGRRVNLSLEGYILKYTLSLPRRNDGSDTRHSMDPGAAS